MSWLLVILAITIKLPNAYQSLIENGMAFVLFIKHVREILYLSSIACLYKHVQLYSSGYE